MDIFGDFKKGVKKHHGEMLKFIQKLESQAKKSNQTTLLKIIEKEKALLKDSMAEIEEKSKALYPVFQNELKKKTGRLEKKIAGLSKAAETLTSDNFLLEYKKKDLLILANKLEEAYEEISLKNKELLEQQKLIAEQAEKLAEVHREILAKNHLLEAQKESLLDQSDYLHEANQTITFMHEKVERQKNEILQKNDELLSLNVEKNNLISIVAHDLKSPLNQIRGLVSVMRMTDSLSEETSNYIAMIEGSSIRLSEMITKILDVEAIESKNLNLKPERIDFSEIVLAIANRYEMAASQKTIRIMKAIKPRLFALVDRSYVDQVIENLVSNAIKFSPSDKQLFINLTDTDEGKVQLEVRDEGPGLNDDDKTKLFGKYQKLSAKPTGSETSTGLGLSIVKKFVTAMDGEIWCESEVGNGASFFVTFKQVTTPGL